jgi:hypothetical protein
MQEPHVFRTAAIVSLAAAIIGAGWMGLQGDDMQVDPPQYLSPARKASLATTSRPGSRFSPTRPSPRFTSFTERFYLPVAASSIARACAAPMPSRAASLTASARA